MRQNQLRDVAAEATCRSLGDQADDVYCLPRPERLGSIGAWYEEFPRLSDDDVRRWLRRVAPTRAAN